MRKLLVLVAGLVLTLGIIAPVTPVEAHTEGQGTKNVCEWIETVRHGLEFNGVIWSRCNEVHWWGEHQVVFRITGNLSHDYYCVIWDHRNFDPDGTAFGFNDGCPGVSGGFTEG